MGSMLSSEADADPSSTAATTAANPSAEGGVASGGYAQPVADEAAKSSSAKSLPPADALIAAGEVITQRARLITDRPLRDDFTIDAKVLGSGMSGPVQLAKGNDGVKYAVKNFKKHGLSKRKRDDLKNEVEVYLKLDHPHIARLVGVYEDDDDINLVMELMDGGELYDRLFDKKVYTEEMAANTAYQMLLAVAYLHSLQIAHRDLKLENFLYENKEGDHLKLIDFGFAKFSERSAKMQQACGSTHYVAPEVLGKSYTQQADLWSLGVICYMCLTGSPPFHGSDDREVLKKIKAGDIRWSSKFHKLSSSAQEFVRSLLVVDPSQRLSAKSALEHPWIKGQEGKRGSDTVIDNDIKLSLRQFARASHFRRAVLSMMAWSLSAEDRNELRQLFLKFDEEKRGTITHKQMKQVLEDLYHIDSVEAEAVFRSMDTDHDDTIAYSEFLAASLQGRVKVYEDVLRRTFQSFDRDASGFIGTDDLKSVLGEHFEGSDAKQLISEADTNGDGQIDYDEFLAYFHKHEEDIGTTETDSPQAALPIRRQRQHTEKLAMVVDKLLEQDFGSDASPTSPLRRKAGRAKTTPAAPAGALS